MATQEWIALWGRNPSYELIGQVAVRYSFAPVLAFISLVPLIGAFIAPR